MSAGHGRKNPKRSQPFAAFCERRNGTMTGIFQPNQPLGRKIKVSPDAPARLVEIHHPALPDIPAPRSGGRTAK